MVKGQIILRLKDGSIVAYANKFLADKTGNDGADPANLKFPGFSGISYYYTGFGNDRFEDQSAPGTIKADFEFLSKQVATGGTGFIKWPETESAATADAGAVDILVREIDDPINSGVTFSRRQILLSEVASINVKEEWVAYPYGKESGYRLPKSSPNFHGFAESKEEGIDRGPDFDKYWTTDDGYIPRPIIELGDKNELTVTNKNEFSEVVIDKFAEGYKVYGVRNYKDDFGKVTKSKKSGTVVAYNHPILSVITKDTNKKEVNIPNSTMKVYEGQTINYGILVDEAGKFNFTKWTTDKKGDTPAPTVMGKEGFTVYAQWEEIKYTVTKNLNYEGAADPEIISVTVGSNITYGTPAERKGYEFVKWTSDPEGNTDAPTVMGKENIVVYAQWRDGVKNFKYSELDTEIPKLNPGVQRLVIDTTGVQNSEFNGRAEGASNFGKKFKTAKPGVIFDLTFALPDGLADSHYIFANSEEEGSLNIKTINITSANGLIRPGFMFYKCKGLETANISKLTSATNTSGLFYGCEKLANVIVDANTFENNTSATGMFNGCSSLTTIDISSLKKVENAATLFFNCNNLTSIDISSLTLTKNTANMFNGCSKLATINWGSIKPENFTDMFAGTNAQKTITVADEETQQFIETNATAMKLDKYTINVANTVAEGPVLKSAPAKAAPKAKAKSTKKEAPKAEPVTKE